MNTQTQLHEMTNAQLLAIVTMLQGNLGSIKEELEGRESSKTVNSGSECQKLLDKPADHAKAQILSDKVNRLNTGIKRITLQQIRNGQLTLPLEVQKYLGTDQLQVILADGKAYLEPLPMSLEDAFGSVKLPESVKDLETFIRESRDEHIERRWGGSAQK